MNSSYKYLLILGLFLISCRGKKSATFRANPSLLSVQEQSIDSSIEAIIAPFRLDLQDEINTVLCQAKKELVKERPEGALGNWVADLVLKESRVHIQENIDICVLNHGGLRAPISAGAVTVGSIFELMPFENTICLLKIDRLHFEQLRALVCQKGGDPIAGFTLSCQGDSSEHLFSDSSIVKNELWVVTTDYLANGGDQYGLVFNTPLKRIDSGIKMRDMMIKHCKGQTFIDAFKDGRISYGNE